MLQKVLHSASHRGFTLYYNLEIVAGWWSGVVVSTLASINEVNLCRPG